MSRFLAASRGNDSLLQIIYLNIFCVIPTLQPLQPVCPKEGLIRVFRSITNTPFKSTLVTIAVHQYIASFNSII